MDVYISEEYVNKRRRERQMQAAADDRKRREVVSELAGKDKAPTKWTTLMPGLGREKGGTKEEDTVFSCLSA
ncbi:hypothetical protein COCNU_scaffold002864G000010 [Cocos nucifera]|nr:hypothetical protein [Cocos nucifera]